MVDGSLDKDPASANRSMMDLRSQLEHGWARERTRSALLADDHALTVRNILGYLRLRAIFLHKLVDLTKNTYARIFHGCSSC